MTTLICWAAVDARAIASVYIASDSLLTDSESGKPLDDAAQKVFACRKRPDIFGYCGNARGLPPLLATFAAELDSRSAPDKQDAYDRANLLIERLNQDLLPHPASDWKNTFILYASRDGAGYSSAAFAVFEVSVRNGRWDFSAIAASKARPDERVVDDHTPDIQELDVISAHGSGARGVRKLRGRWTKFHDDAIVREGIHGTTRSRTSRGVFGALCTALMVRNKDARSGGAPQVAGIHQHDAARSLGVIWRGQRFHEGKPIAKESAVALNTRWHDRLFQLCDPVTMAPQAEAAIHDGPKGLDVEPSQERPSKRKLRRRKMKARSQPERERAREIHRRRFVANADRTKDE